MGWTEGLRRKFRRAEVGRGESAVGTVAKCDGRGTRKFATVVPRWLDGRPAAWSEDPAEQELDLERRDSQDLRAENNELLKKLNEIEREVFRNETVEMEPEKILVNRFKENAARMADRKFERSFSPADDLESVPIGPGAVSAREKKKQSGKKRRKREQQ